MLMTFNTPSEINQVLEVEENYVNGIQYTFRNQPNATTFFYFEKKQLIHIAYGCMRIKYKWLTLKINCHRKNETGVTECIDVHTYLMLFNSKKINHEYASGLQYNPHNKHAYQMKR